MVALLGRLPSISIIDVLISVFARLCGNVGLDTSRIDNLRNHCLVSLDKGQLFVSAAVIDYKTRVLAPKNERMDE